MKLFAVQPYHFLISLMFITCLVLNINVHASGDYDAARGLYGQHSPDFPLNNFVNGQLGVIDPDYRLSYLIIAYRYLSNNPLSKKEQRNVLDTLGHYFSNTNFSDDDFSDNDFKVDAYKSNEEISRQANSVQIYNAEDLMYHWWKKTRELPIAERVQTIIRDYPKDIKPFTKFKLASIRLESIFNELNAAKLPEEKINTLLQAWLHAQDQLFNKKYDGEKIRETIREIPDENLSLLKSDTDYMRAVSYFNSGNEKERLTSYELFTKLARNDQYPWHEWADYLSYRALTRVACQDFNSLMPDAKQTGLLSTALTGMQALAVNARDPAVKEAANDYKNIIKGRLDPTGAIVELVNQMNQKITKDNFSNMIFYNELMGWNDRMPNSPQVLNLDKITEDSSEILFWLINYLSRDEQKSFETAYKNWLETPENLAWLLVALNNITKADASQQTQLLHAAEQVTPERPGFFSIRSSLIQALFLLEGDSQQSVIKRHALIDNTLAQLKAGEDFSTHMHFSKMGIPLASSIDNLLSYGFFIPSPAMLTFYGPKTPTANPYFSPLELSQALNDLPLSVLVKVIQSKQLPPIPKQELYASVWARAMILGQYAIADKIVKKTGKLNPDLKKLIRSSLRIKNPDQRLKILVRTLLYFPELSPIINLKSTWTPEFDLTPVYYGIKPRKITDYNSRTYWCNHGEINVLINNDQPPSRFSPTPWPGLLTAKQQTQLDAEQAQLKALPDGAKWLADNTNELAKKYPEDKENAELLALAINVTRVLLCYQQDSHASRRAYTTLHRLYSTSDGAKRTKYYY